jgi:hypothetical protein
VCGSWVSILSEEEIMSGLYEYAYKGVSEFDAVLSGTPLNSFLLRVLGGDKKLGLVWRKKRSRRRGLL